MTCVNFLKTCKSALCLVLLLCSFLSYASSVNLQGESVDANSIVTDLKEGNRKVFAIGNVDSHLTLLVSSAGSSGEYEVSVSESKGVFKVTGDPKAVASVPGDASVKFVCSDSTGSFLVGMSSSSIGALQLPSGSYEKTGVTQHARIDNCFDDGNIHLASSDPLHYYTFNPSDGTVTKFNFDKDNIKASDQCSGDPILGQLCISGKSISIKDKCDGSPPSGLISGFVGSGTVYLIDGSNTVYTFPSSAFATNGQSAKLNKIAKKDAFVGPHNNLPTGTPATKTTDNSEKSSSVLIIALIGVLLILVVGFCIVVYCCFFKGGKKKENKAGDSGKKSTQKMTSVQKKKSSTGSPSSKKKINSKKSSKSPRGKSSSHRSSSKLPKNTASSRR